MPAICVSVTIRVAPTLQILVLLISQFGDSLLISVAILEKQEAAQPHSPLKQFKNKGCFPSEPLVVK